MLQVSIEKATHYDLPLFAEMEQVDGTSEFISQYSLDEHHRKFDEPQINYLRITNAGAIVGFFILALEPDGTSVEFRRIVVSDKGNGIGQVAIRQMEEFCKDELGRSRIWLDVLETNYIGRHIYDKLGYQQFGEQESQGERLLLCEKQIH